MKLLKQIATFRAGHPLANPKIETLQQKLACLKQVKKVWMQQPLTGKHRVKVDEL